MKKSKNSQDVPFNKRIFRFIGINKTKKIKRPKADLSNITWYKRTFWWSRLCLLLLMLFALIGMVGYAGYLLKYDLKTSIEYSGGYQTIAAVYDYNKAPQGGKPVAGDAKKDLQYLRERINALGDKNFYFQVVGGNRVLVRSPRSYFDSASDFMNTINENGGLFLMSQVKNNSGMNVGNDLLLTKDKKTNKTERNSITNVLASPTSTVNNQQEKKPVLQFQTKSGWSAPIKALASAKNDKNLYVWRDIGLLLDNIRKYYSQNYSDWRSFISNLKTFYQAADSGLKVNMAKVFTFDYETAGGNKNTINLMEQGIPTNRQMNNIFKNIQWTIPYSTFNINPVNDKKTPEVVTTNETNYFDPWEPSIMYLSSKISSFDQDFQQYFLNWYEINKTSTKPQFKGTESSITFLTKSESDATVTANLLKGGLAGAGFYSNVYSEIPPAISKGLLLTTEIILGAILIAFGAYIIFLFRMLAVITFINFGFGVFMVVYISSLLSVNLSPIALAGWAITFIMIMSGMLLIFNRYRSERLNKDIAALPAFKISIKKNLPFFIDGMVVFLIVALSMFWFTSGVIKNFSIVFLISVLVGFVSIVFLTIFLYWLFLTLNLQEKVTFLDVQKILSFKIRRIKFTKKSQIAKTVDKVNVAELIESANKKAAEDAQAEADKQDPTNDPNLHNAQEDTLVIKEKIANMKKDQSKSRKLHLIKNNKVTFWFKQTWNKAKPYLTLYNLFRWTPLAVIVVAIVAAVLLATGSANMDQSVRRGTMFEVNYQVWNQKQDGGYVSGENEIKYLKNVAAEKEKPQVGQNYVPFDLSAINADFYLGKSINATTQDVVYIATKINSEAAINNFTNWIWKTSAFGGNPGQQWIIDYATDPILSNQLIDTALIAIAISIGLIVAYTLFRFDWAQFVAIVACGAAAVIFTISIVVVAYIPISLNVITMFAGVWVFALVNSTFVMAKARENKKKFDIEAYNNFFRSKHNYINEQKLLKSQIKYKKHASLVYMAKGKIVNETQRNTDEANKNVYLVKNTALKRKYLLETKKDVAANAAEYQRNIPLRKQMLKTNRKKFSKYNWANNFLYKTANMTIKNLFLHFVFISIIAIVTCVLLSFLSGDVGTFFITLLIGILVSLYVSFVIALPIWVRLESIRALNKVKFNKYLNNKKTMIDEQSVKGINS